MDVCNDFLIHVAEMFIHYLVTELKYSDEKADAESGKVTSTISNQIYDLLNPRRTQKKEIIENGKNVYSIA